MKKIYLKALGLSAFLFCTLQLFSQITTSIDYQNSSLSTSCNVFASATMVDGVSHQTSIGKVGFNTGSPALIIENRRTGATYNSGQFRISYGFKQGYSYVLKITAAAIENANNDPHLRVNFSNTSLSSTQCNMGDVGSSLSGNLIKSVAIGSTTYSEKSFSYPNLQNAFPFLLVDAVPQEDSSFATLYIRKIVIEEGPPPVSFTITPSASNVECGTATAKNFTINNVYSTPNVTNYTWNLGSANNGWIYNGSPAPQTINTSTTNTISLTPACGASSLSNVSSVVTANGNAYNTNAFVPTIVHPAMAVTGSDVLCSGTTNYTISGLPCNATVSWSVDGAQGIATINQSGVLTKTGNGPINVRATVTACGIQSQALAKTVTVGFPGAAFGMTILDPNVEGAYMCPNTQYYAEAAFNGPLYDQYFWVLPVDWYSPDWGGGSSYFTSTGQYALVRIITASYPTSGYITVYGVNNCGMGDPFQFYVSTESCGGLFMYRISPNPASSVLTVEATENALKVKEDIGEIRLFDAQGFLKIQRKYAKGTKKVQLNVTALREGVYFIEIGNGTKKIRKPVLIRR